MNPRQALDFNLILRLGYFILFFLSYLTYAQPMCSMKQLFLEMPNLQCSLLFIMGLYSLYSWISNSQLVFDECYVETIGLLEPRVRDFPIYLHYLGLGIITMAYSVNMNWEMRKKDHTSSKITIWSEPKRLVPIPQNILCFALSIKPRPRSFRWILSKENWHPTSKIIEELISPHSVDLISMWLMKYAFFL